MAGWVKVFRSLLEWEWYKKPNMVHLFIHLLLSANHESKKWQGVEIKRGQLVTGRKSLSKATGISERSIRTCLEMLKTTNELTIKTTNKYSIITICKYEDYQELKSISDQQSDQLKANKRPTTDHKQEDKEDKEDNISFDDFWNSYHEITQKVKTDKEAAQKYWNKLKEPERQKAIEMIKPYFLNLTDTKYCKKARTYLADKNFNDEYTVNKGSSEGTSTGKSFGHLGGFKENPNWHDPRLPREVE